MTSLMQRLSGPSITNRPPTADEQRDNDLAVVAWIIAMLIVGLLLRNAGESVHRSASLGEGLPDINYPVSWFQGRTDEGLLKATDPASPSSFNAFLKVSKVTLAEGQDLSLGRAGWSVKQSRALENYRELDATVATLLGDRPALAVGYAYIADPSRDSAAVGLPVVVQAQDILFQSGADLVVITVAADAADWEDELEDFQMIFDSLELELQQDGEAR